MDHGAIGHPRPQPPRDRARRSRHSSSAIPATRTAATVATDARGATQPRSLRPISGWRLVTAFLPATPCVQGQPAFRGGPTLSGTSGVARFQTSSHSRIDARRLAALRAVDAVEVASDLHAAWRPARPEHSRRLPRKPVVIDYGELRPLLDEHLTDNGELCRTSCSRATSFDGSSTVCGPATMSPLAVSWKPLSR